MRSTTRLAVSTPLGALAVVVLLTGSGSLFVPAPPAARFVYSDVATQTAFDQKIDHIVIMMMENHAFDNYFGNYCPKVTKRCPTAVDGLPKGTCVPFNTTNLSQGCVPPYPLSRANWTVHGALPHSSNASLTSWDNGSMDGFYAGEHSGLSPFGYYTARSAPVLWDLAEEYGLGDAFFSATLSSSLPNHWHLIAGQTPPEAQTRVFQVTQRAGLANRTAYLNEANNTSAVEDLLNNTNVSWNWYDHPIASNYSSAILSTNATGPRGTTFLLWNPMAAKAESYNASFHGHFVSNTQFFADAHNGTLPNVSYVIPPGPLSDHPPASSGKAQRWIANVVNALEFSPEWNSTALFITYDEYGGFYDHVAPPVANGTNATLGFRVPFLVVSPYARENYVSHSPGYFESLLRLVEDRFNLSCLTVVDCNAPSLMQYFDFNQTPRAPIYFSTNLSNLSYPMPLQGPMHYASWTPRSYLPDRDMVYWPEGEGPDVC